MRCPEGYSPPMRCQRYCRDCRQEHGQRHKNRCPLGPIPRDIIRLIPVGHSKIILLGVGGIQGITTKSIARSFCLNGRDSGKRHHHIWYDHNGCPKSTPPFYISFSLIPIHGRNPFPARQLVSIQVVVTEPVPIDSRLRLPGRARNHRAFVVCQIHITRANRGCIATTFGH